MSQPALNINELDGALGVLPAGDLAPAFVGVSDSGPTNAPAGYASKRALVTAFGAGPLVEALARYVEVEGRPVVAVRTGQTTAGSFGTIDTTGVTGTSAVTLGATPPNDDYESRIRIITGGTIGTPGIVLRYSLDDGRTESPDIALESANTYVIPGSGGVTYDFAAGTLVAGDIAKARCNAPQWDGSEMTAALDALANTELEFGCVFIVGNIDGSLFDTIETGIAAIRAAGKPVYWIGNARIPNDGESEASYLSALTGIFSAKASTVGSLAAGACELTSSVSGRRYRRPASWAYGPRAMAVDDHINIANINRGLLQGVSLSNAVGNPKHHNESVNPGLDDARFTVLRTWPGRQGVYCNRPRLFSATGSDFQLIPHRRVIDLAHRALRAYFIARLNEPIQVDTSTGFILESEALEIEQGGDSAVRSVLMAVPKASGGGFEKGRFLQISRTDNLLSTKTMTGQARIVPLAYPEFINLDLGFFNPALQLVQV